jgi:hypothetical protein
MLNLLVLAILIGLLTFYLTSVMVYNFADEDSNGGPLKLPNIVVYNTFTFQARPANLFDAIRALTNFYTLRDTDKNTHIWEIKQTAVDGVWACPHCLGFWVAAVLTFFLARQPEIPFFILTFGAAAGWSSFLHYAVEALENGKSLREMQRGTSSQERSDESSQSDEAG